jgi:putative DNA primase/helicase
MSTTNKLRLPPCTDAGNAEFFAALYKNRLRFDHLRKKWLIWHEHWWQDDADGEVLRLAKQAARYRLQCTMGIPDDGREKQVKWAVSSESRNRLEATLALAQAEHPIADAGINWDADAWLFGVRNGVIDLRTGKLRDGQPSDFVTLHSDFSFNPCAKCDRWVQFLGDIFLQERELIDFVQRVVGYNLTGDTREQCAYLCWGDGSNGKSTFLEVLRRVFGSYAQNLPFSAFELKARASIPNDMASLIGRRFVTAIETDETVRLNESRIKALTGEDSITARFLYKEFFTFRPAAKVWLAFNRKPLVADDSHGFWRRIRLIKFLASFKDGMVDKQLVSKLTGEAEGILAWAVRGCLAWQAQGLGMPVAISDATAAYREESDPLRDFISDRCVLHKDAQIQAGLLWQCYCDWAKDNALGWPLNRQQFSTRLEGMGLRKSRTGHDRTWTWLGICRLVDADIQNISLPDLRTDADANIQ